MNIGDGYRIGEFEILVLHQDDFIQDDYIWIIALRFPSEYGIISVNFIPIHGSCLPKNMEYIGQGIVLHDQLEHDINRWKDINQGGKSYFTQDLVHIKHHVLQLRKQYNSNLIPLIMPVVQHEN